MVCDPDDHWIDVIIHPSPAHSIATDEASCSIGLKQTPGFNMLYCLQTL